QERAIRHALGATTARSLAESTAQNLMLGFAGGIAGLGLASILLEALIRLAPDGIPYLDQASINWRVLVFAMGASVLATILPSVSIALQRP
ncbi:FtsX-like permease family protein, partial [Methylobacterium crusticola]|uniref:FtsX-like permease family protein n=1 Tax=Methylobacterium crusticola TaxID=1697972 RepID=UPI001EE168D7